MTKVVDGGWWEGICGDRVGWFPGLYVEEISAGTYMYRYSISSLIFRLKLQCTFGTELDIHMLGGC